MPDKMSPVESAALSSIKGSGSRKRLEQMCSGKLPANMALNEGSTAPDFRLPADDGTEFSLSDCSEPVLLVFYPGDNTPVCTAQLCDYRDNISAFQGLGIKVVGISKDDRASHQAFKEKHNLPFALLTDSDCSVAEKFGARSLMGGMKRGVVLIGADNKVLYSHIESVALFKRSAEELKDVLQKLKQEGKV
ncbi:MAG TPA: peroxiredoxin [Leptospiraceae bacterium]|nr:peroxiredoxin [Leptospiraceae bacterium]